MSRKKGNLKKIWILEKHVLLLAEKIRKKSARGKCFKSSVQNIAYFNKENVFVILNKRNIDGKTFYWLIDTHRK